MRSYLTEKYLNATTPPIARIASPANQNPISSALIFTDENLSLDT